MTLKVTFAAGMHLSIYTPIHYEMYVCMYLRHVYAKCRNHTRGLYFQVQLSFRNVIDSHACRPTLCGNISETAQDVFIVIITDH